jgi:hypothetical protein
MCKYTGTSLKFNSYMYNYVLMLMSTCIYAYMYIHAHVHTLKSQILRMKEMKKKMLGQLSNLRGQALNSLLLIARDSSQSLLDGKRTRTLGRVAPAPPRCGPGWRNYQNHSRRRSSHSRVKGALSSLLD